MTEEQAQTLLSLISEYGSARHHAATALLTTPDEFQKRTEDADAAYAAVSAAVWGMVTP